MIGLCTQLYSSASASPLIPTTIDFHWLPLQGSHRAGPEAMLPVQRSMSADTLGPVCTCRFRSNLTAALACAYCESIWVLLFSKGHAVPARLTQINHGWVRSSGTPGDLAPRDLAPRDLAPGDLAPGDLALQVIWHQLIWHQVIWHQESDARNLALTR
jgi:hypothetical protein